MAPNAAWAQTTPSAPAPKKPKSGQTPDWEALLNIDPILVQSSPLDTSRVGGSAQVVTKQQLEQFNYDDVHRVLNQVPGVYVRQEDAFGLRPNIGMRGASSDRSGKVTLMEDGILLGPAPYSAPAAYYFPIVTRMESLEVFKGPASIQYGPQTVGGALNWITRPIPEAQRATLDVAAGQYRTGKLHGSWGTRSRYTGAMVEGVHLQSDGFKNLDGGGNTGFDKNEFLVKLQLNTDLSKKISQAVELRLGYSDEKSHETYLGLSDSDFASTPYRRYVGSEKDLMQWHRTQVQVRHLLHWGDALDVRTTFYRHDFSRAWRKLNRFRGGPNLHDLLTYSSGQSGVFLDVLRGTQDSEGEDQDLLVGTNQRDYLSQGVQMVGIWRSDVDWFSQELELGMRIHNDEINRHHTEDAYQVRQGSLVSAQQAENTTRRNDVSTFAWAFHVLDRMQFGEHLFINPGLRLELIDWNYQDTTDPAQPVEQNNVYAVLIPGIGAVYQPFAWLNLLAGVHRGFSPTAPGPDKNAEPESSINYEAGLRLTHGQTRLETIGFFNDYSNLTAVCAINRGCTDAQLGLQTSAGSVYVYGIETSAEQKVPLMLGMQASARVNYTLTVSKFQNAFESTDPLFGDVSVGDALPYVPVHQAAAIVGIAHKLFSVNISAAYVGDMRDVAGQGAIPAGERIADYLVVDVAGSVQVSETDQLYAHIDNLFDNAYMVSRRPFGARPGLPFQLMLGYKGTFD
ncbi:MAG: TonB-dependent receptor [Myxococcales bacterium]|nr:TonB-dependent receptor [Myxococcales bacterium]